MSVEEVESFEIPTATPIVYTFSQSGRPLQWHYLDKNAELSKTA
jgi:bisphosphoglycerate-dependent phosphoglycerate mutase